MSDEFRELVTRLSRLVAYGDERAACKVIDDLHALSRRGAGEKRPLQQVVDLVLKLAEDGHFVDVNVNQNRPVYFDGDDVVTEPASAFISIRCAGRAKRRLRSDIMKLAIEDKLSRPMDKVIVTGTPIYGVFTGDEEER